MPLALDTNPWDFKLMASVGRAAPGADPEALEPGPDPVAVLERGLQRVSRRVRIQRALSHGATLGIAGVGVAALGVCLLEIEGGRAALPWFACAALLPLLGVLAGALRPVSPLLAARLLDRALGQPDLVASAWSFSRIAAAERSPFMRACLRQGAVHAASAEPSRALPLRAPRALRQVGWLSLGTLALTLVEVPVLAPVAAPEPARPRLLHQDDVQAFREDVAPLLEARAADPLIQQTAGELNALLEALHEGELERAQALAELRALEKKLELEIAEGDEEALREALRGLGRTLERGALAESVAEAMQDADAAAARTELQKLAQALREGGQREQALRDLAKAVERAGERHAQDDRALAQARKEIERLLKKRNQADGQSERERRLLHKKKRELERLEREQAQRERAERKLERFRRELSQAAPALHGKRGGEAGEQLERAAEQLAQAQREQLGQEQRERLRERLEQLRELISKQRGQGQNGERQADGRAGQSQRGEVQRLDLDRLARSSRGQRGKQGDGKGEAGQHGTPGKPGGKLLVPGQGGDSDMTLLLPGEGQARMAGQTGEPIVQSSSAGEGGRPETAEATRMQSKRVDTRVQGEHGRGATRSEVIHEAGQRGFVSRGYERVHADYERHAEAVLERDRVPGGYRFYVRRYFQLIRPREGEP